MDANQVLELLNEKAESFCQWLFPEGVRKGKDWCVGSLDGEKGASLKICLEGDKAGIWIDFASGEEVKGANLVSLLMKKRGTTVWHHSLFEAKEWLGLPIEAEDDRFYRQRSRNEGKFQSAAPDHVALDRNGPVYRYLTEQRGLSDAALKLYRVRQHKTSATMAFCQASTDKKSVMFVKYVDVARQAVSEKKVEWTDPKGGRPGLWGKHAIGEDASEIVITEGEIDCISLAEIGESAVSIPMGVNNHDWVELDWKWLERFNAITLLFDNDEAGEKGASEAVQKLINRLGRARCRVATLPKGVKDPNEAILKGIGDDLVTAIGEAKSFDPAELKSVSEYRQQTKDSIFPVGGHVGKSFFIKNDGLRTRPGEISLWTGINSHGKSSALLQNMLHLASEGERVLVACMEAPAYETARILCRQAHAAFIRKVEEFDAVWDAIEPHFWIYDVQDVVKRDEMIETFEYAFRRYGITQFVVDSFMTLDVPKDDYNAQSRIMDSLRVFAIKFGVHIHLVAHSRKGKDESERPGKMDVSGHADITNKAFNGYTVWRNLSKEKRLTAALDVGNEAEFNKIRVEEPDAEIICWKQRATGYQPTLKLWFERGSLQYLPGPHAQPKRYLLPPPPPTTRPITDEDFA